jgi:hypothetical protein
VWSKSTVALRLHLLASPKTRGKERRSQRVDSRCVVHDIGRLHQDYRSQVTQQNRKRRVNSRDHSSAIRKDGKYAIKRRRTVHSAACSSKSGLGLSIPPAISSNGLEYTSMRAVERGWVCRLEWDSSSEDMILAVALAYICSATRMKLFVRSCHSTCVANYHLHCS